MHTHRWRWFSWLLGMTLACGQGSEQSTDSGTSGESTSETETGTDTEIDTDTDTDTDTDGEPEPVIVDWDEATHELLLIRSDEVLLRFPSDGIALGEVTELDDDLSYDPYYLEPDRWLAFTDGELLAEQNGGVEVRLSYEGGHTALLTVVEQAEGRFVATLQPTSGSGAALAYYRLQPVVDTSEGFYGLGEYFDTPQHRGKVRAMQLEAGIELESNYNEAHVPVSFVTGTRGWGLYVASDYPATFDVAATANDRVAATVGTGPATGDGLEFYLFAADHPLDVTRHYYDVTGYPRKPAPWALGPWVWRDENDDQAQVESDLQTIRDLDLATSAYWIDRPYAQAVNTFDFQPDQFPTPQAMIDLAHSLGFRMALWHAPYVDADAPEAAQLRAEAEMEGYFPPTTALLVSNWEEPVDFTNPDAYAWWQQNLDNYIAMGIEGFKLDYAEDVTVGIAGARTKWEFFDGSSERTMHKHYARLYHQVYDDLLMPDGGFLLSRAGAAGDQTITSVVWPGDLDANMAQHGEQVVGDGDSYTAVGGLPAAVAAGLSLGPSGYPLFASDTGGYRHSPPNRETFTRWFEHTTFTPVMQVGTSTNDVAWEPTPENMFDAETLDWYREYTRLHLRLFPYSWTLFQRLFDDGRPLLRALGLAHPELGAHPPDIYLFGDALLLAPVVTPGQTSREVVFPPGLWVHWFTGEQVDAGDAGTTQTIAAPLGTTPAFIRDGQLVPLLRPTIDTLAPVDNPDLIDSFATDSGILYARAYVSSKTARFTTYDGAYLEVKKTATGHTISVTAGEVFAHGAQIELLAYGSPPASVMEGDNPVQQQPSLQALEDAASGWFFDGSQLHVRMAATATVTITSG